jgi:hypothetical protein
MEETAMPEEKGRLARAAKLAYELAQTGKFENFSAVARELVAVGYKGEIHSFDRPGFRAAIDEVCVTGRERDVDTWHQHTAV